MADMEDTGKKVVKRVTKKAAEGVDTAAKVAKGAAGKAAGAAGKAADAAGDVAGAGVDAAKGALGAVGGLLGGAAGKVTKAAKAAQAAAASAADKAADMAGDAVDAAKGAAGKAAAIAGDVAGDAVDAAKGAAGKAADLAGDAVDAAKGAVGKAGEVVGDVAEGTMGAAKGVANVVTDVAGDAVDAAKGAAGAVGDMAEDAVNKLGGAGAAALGASAAALGGAAAAVGGFGKSAAEMAGDVAGGAASLASGAADKVGDVADSLMAEKRGGGVLMPLIGVLAAGALAWWALNQFVGKDAAPQAPATAEASAEMPAWLSAISDKIKGAFSWISVGVSGKDVIASGEAPDQAAKDAALKELTLAVKGAAEGGAASVLDNITVKGSTVTPIAAALAALGATPDVAACNTAFGSTMNGRTINFASGGAAIAGDNAALLDTLTAVANACKTHTIEIAGHTDSVGEAAANETLSQARADAVKAYWTGKDVAAEGLIAKGYGEAKPLEPVADNTASEKNRRIEFTVTETVAAPK